MEFKTPLSLPSVAALAAGEVLTGAQPQQRQQLQLTPGHEDSRSRHRRLFQVEGTVPVSIKKPDGTTVQSIPPIVRGVCTWKTATAKTVS